MKLGIVFEGGASRSLFTCGVIDALLEENIFADYVIGVSAGIAYGSSYISRQKGRNLELSLKYMSDKRYMGMKHLLNPKTVHIITANLHLEESLKSWFPTILKVLKSIVKTLRQLLF